MLWSSSNALIHVKDHGFQTGRAATAEKKTTEAVDKVSTITTSPSCVLTQPTRANPSNVDYPLSSYPFQNQANMSSAIYGTDPKRFFTLMFTWTFQISKMLPFSFGKEDEVQQFLRLVCKTEFQGAKMYEARAKTHIVELYAHTKDIMVSELRAAKALGAILPCISYNVDLWKSKISGDKYLGKPNLLV